MIGRPGPEEHAEYYGTYVRLVPDGDILHTLETQVEDTAAVLSRVPPEGESFCYAPGKWSVRATLGHIIDVERMFQFRCLHMARGDTNALPGMDQDLWASGSNADGRTLASLMDELRAVRRSTLLLLSGLDEAALGRRGTASGVEFTVRSFPWIMAGHERHHVRLLEERYLPEIGAGGP